MPRIEAITRTAEARIRPVLLTTITTMAGLAPMMFGVSLDFANGGYTVDSPTALWWTQLATAVVFGLGIATVLTLVVTPSLLALRVWWARSSAGSPRAPLAPRRTGRWPAGAARAGTSRTALPNPTEQPRTGRSPARARGPARPLS
jgi:multidrug efflux pump